MGDRLSVTLVAEILLPVLGRIPVGFFAHPRYGKNRTRPVFNS